MGLEPLQTLANSAIAAIADPAQRRTSGLTPWKPGQSGNPNGRPPSARFRKAFQRQLRLHIAEDVTRLDCVADAIVAKAETGDVPAFVAVRDTVDGKPVANDNRPTVGAINIAWGTMPQWCAQPALDAATAQPVIQCDNTIDCSLNSNTPPEVQLKVLESAPRRHAQTQPTRIKLSERVPVRAAAPAVSVPATKPMSITRMVAERALAKLAEMDTTGMSPATFKNYLAKVRVAEETLAAL